MQQIFWVAFILAQNSEQTEISTKYANVQILKSNRLFGEGKQTLVFAWFLG